MPIAIPQSPGQPESGPRALQTPYHLREQQNYAVTQERMRHDQALYSLGEYAAFVLMWHIQDFEAGLVTRCSRCYGENNLIAQVYEQPVENKCPVCFGTTFDGGYKAILVRPSIWDTNEEDFRLSARGEVIVQTASVQSTSDFRLRTGD